MKPAFVTALAANSPTLVPWLKTTPAFSFEASAIRAAHELSITDWREWFPSALPPFKSFVLDWRPGDFVVGDADQWTREGVIFEDGFALFSGMYPSGAIAALPLDVMVHQPVGPMMATGDVSPYQLPETIKDYLWGPALVKQFGRPELDVRLPKGLAQAAIKSGKRWEALVDQLADVFLDLAGLIRVFYAQLALMNAEKEIIPQTPVARDGRGIIKGKSVPRFKPHTIVLRPDAPRRVSMMARDITAAWHRGSPKREHDVRSHFRTLKSGRRVVVRAHQRGDASLGRVEKNYLIELDPNRNLPQGQRP
jgi:hypothetical protein